MQYYSGSRYESSKVSMVTLHFADHFMREAHTAVMAALNVSYVRISKFDIAVFVGTPSLVSNNVSGLKGPWLLVVALASCSVTQHLSTA